MPNYAAIAESLTSPEAFLAQSDEPQIFGAKKQAVAAHALWTSAEQRFVGGYRALRAPGGTGTGFIVRLFWDPAQVTPDLDAIALAVQTALPVELTKADEKATYKGRDKKQGAFFAWQGVTQRPLSAWFHERFGVWAFATQLFDASDLAQDTAVVATTGGTAHVWPLTAKS